MAFNIKSLQGLSRDKAPIIGAVKVNKPFDYCNRSYECAAWSETSTAEVGVYPVVLRAENTYRYNLYCEGLVGAKVTHDWFPALWGGVAISNEPYKQKHTGEARTIYKGIDLVEAVEATGNSPDGDINWFIHPSWWPVVMGEAVTELREDYKRLPEFWGKWDELDPATFKPKDDRWGFSDEYRSRVGMVAHFGSNLEKWARRIEKLTWRAGQWHQASAYMQELHAKNTEWAKAIPILINE